jgi:hypothetical protein
MEPGPEFIGAMPIKELSAFGLNGVNSVDRSFD